MKVEVNYSEEFRGAVARLYSNDKEIITALNAKDYSLGRLLGDRVNELKITEGMVIECQNLQDLKDLARIHTRKKVLYGCWYSEINENCTTVL